MRRGYLALVILAAALVGCTSARKSTLNAEGDQGVFKQATPLSLSAKEYRMAPPDRIKIHAPAIKEIDNLDVQIRPDGKVTLNLLGDLYISGKTPEEVGQLLTKAATTYYVNPVVTVEVTDYKSKAYSMFGMVVTPGQKPYTGRDSVLSALAAAGFNDDSWPQQVSVSRPARGAQQPANATAIIDLKKMYMTGDLSQNYMLEEGDIIYVPDSPLAGINKGMIRILGPVTGAGSAVGTGQSIGKP